MFHQVAMHTPLQIGWDRDVCYLTESISCIAKSLQGVDSGLARYACLIGKVAVTAYSESNLRIYQ